MKTIHYQICDLRELRVSQLVGLSSIAYHYQSAVCGKTEDMQVDIKSVISTVNLIDSKSEWLMICIDGEDEDVAAEAIEEYLRTL